MAITALEFVVLTELSLAGRLPRGRPLLEFGRQSWYADVPLDKLAEFASRRLGPETAGFLAELRSVADAINRGGGREEDGLFRIARLFYGLAFDPSDYLAVDLDEGPEVHRHDLNEPLDLGRRFGVVTNIGTAEHVFDLRGVFKAIHDHTEPGGLMVHTAPFNGWWDHGFYCLQPTLFFDLAAANGYEVLAVTCAGLSPFKAVRLESRDDVARLADRGGIPTHAIINYVLRKGDADHPFRVPIQGYYAGTLSEEGRKAWKRLR